MVEPPQTNKNRNKIKNNNDNDNDNDDTTNDELFDYNLV